MTVETFTTPGAFTWPCPVGVSSVDAECWAGAGGGSSKLAGGAGSVGKVVLTYTIVPISPYSTMPTKLKLGVKCIANFSIKS